MKRTFHVVILVLACVLAYSNTFENGFQFDDLYRVQNNPGVQEFWSPLRHFVDESTSATLPRLRQYRPLLPLSLSVNYAIAGDSLVGYHVGNLLLHILASCALYLLLVELFAHWGKATLPQRGPLLVALLFALHPVSGVLVNYICARDLLMMQMFLLASLCCYARMRRLGESRWRWAMCLGLLLLALLAKKNAVVAPVLILLFEVILAGRSIRDGGAWRRVAPFAAVVVVLMLFVRFVIGFADLENVISGDAGGYAAAQAQHHVFHYLRNFVWPFPIRMAAADVIEPWKQVVGAAGIVASLVLAWRWRGSRPLLAFGICSYWVLLAVTSSVVPFHSDLVAYRPYPSSAFLFLGLGVTALRWPRAGTVVLVGLAVYFGVASLALNPVWKDRETMFRHSIGIGGTEMAYAGLADALPNGPTKVAMYLEAIELAPTYVIAHVGLGFTQIAMGETDAGLRRTRRAVDLAPHNAQIIYCAAQSFALAGELDAAAGAAARASELLPSHDDYRSRAAWYAVDAGQFAAALRLLKPLLDHRPDYGRTRFFAGMAHLGLRQNQAAIAMFQAYGAANPTDARGWFYMGAARMAEANHRGAVAALQRCLAADPGFRDAHGALAECYTKLGNATEASRHDSIYRQSAPRK